MIVKHIAIDGWRNKIYQKKRKTECWTVRRRKKVERFRIYEYFNLSQCYFKGILNILENFGVTRKNT